MGSGVVPSGVTIPVYHSVYAASSGAKSSFSISFPSLARPSGGNGGLGCGLAHGLVLSGSRKSKGRSLKQSCRANYEDEPFDEMSIRAEELLQRLNISVDYGRKDEGASWVVSKVYKRYQESKVETCSDNGFSMQFSSLRLHSSLEPSLLGINPKPPDWPGRREVVSAGIERKANSLQLPMSLRILQKKYQWEQSFSEVGEYITFSSLSKAFSSMVFIIHEIHSYALSIRGSLYCEDFKGIIAKVQKDMNFSFVWLFQQVFSGSPTLMVYVMILLANFTVYSMNDNVVIPATALPAMAEILDVIEEREQRSRASPSSIVVKTCDRGKDIPSERDTKAIPARDRLSSMKIPSEEMINLSPMSTEDYELWRSVEEEASKMQAELRAEALDHATALEFVSPIDVNLEADDYDCYFKTDIVYQMGLAREPDNQLLLSNYAQFLYLVVHDHKRAEEFFQRAAQAEEPDAEALSRYADFLWLVKKDFWGAEEKYLEAVSAEPRSHYYASKYANFLWNTGGEETCYPLNSPSYDTVL